MQYREFEGPVIAMGGNWMTKIAAEKIENVSLIFSNPSQSPQDPRIYDIESSSYIFRNLLSAISNSRVPRLRWEGGRKLWPKKLETPAGR